MTGRCCRRGAVFCPCRSIGGLAACRREFLFHPAYGPLHRSLRRLRRPSVPPAGAAPSPAVSSPSACGAAPRRRRKHRSSDPTVPSRRTAPAPRILPSPADACPATRLSCTRELRRNPPAHSSRLLLPEYCRASDPCRSSAGPSHAALPKSRTAALPSPPPP